MSSTSGARREQVYCHSCQEEWFRDEHGLTCPHCQSDFVEIIEGTADDPREDHLHISPLDDLALDPPIWHPGDPPPSDDNHDHHHNGMQWTATGPNSYTFRNTYQIPSQANNPNNPPSSAPTLPPIGGILGGILNMMGATQPSTTANNGATRSYRFASPTGGAHFSITTSTAGGFGPRDANNPAAPNMPVQDLQHLLQMFQPPAHGQPRVAGENGAFDNRTLFDILLGGAGGQYAHSQEEFDRIVSDLMERTQANSGAPAATEDAIDSLPKKPVDKAMLGDSGKAECTICMAEVDLGEVVTELYCKHWFHTDCIKVWLEQHNTCPHCRKSIEEGKTERERKQGGSATGKDSIAAESSSRAPSSSAPWNRPAPPPPGAWPAAAAPAIPGPHTRPAPPGNRPSSWMHRSESDARRARSERHHSSTREYPRDDGSYDGRDYAPRRRSQDEQRRRRRRSEDEHESPGILQRARDWIAGHGTGGGHS